MSVRRIAALDGLRAVGCVLVIGYHYLPATWLPSGRLGVDVFFPLSGFLITSLLVAEHRDRGGIAWGRFMRRRAARLVPALVATVALTGVFFVWMTAAHTFGAWTAVAASALTYTYDIGVTWLGLPPVSGLGPTWTLALEEQFYLVWSMLLLIVLPRWGVRVALRFAGVLTLLAWLELLVTGHEFDPIGRSGSLFVGCLAALAYADSGQARSLAARVGPTLPALAALGALYLATRWPLASTRLWVPLMGLAVALLVPGLLARPRALLTRVLGVAPLQWLGERSYGLYLIHLPVFFIVLGLMHASPTDPTHAARLHADVIAFPIAVALAAVSYRWLEVPARAWLSRTPTWAIAPRRLRA